MQKQNPKSSPKNLYSWEPWAIAGVFKSGSASAFLPSRAAHPNNSYFKILTLNNPPIHYLSVIFCLTLNRCEPKKILIEISKPWNGWLDILIRVDKTPSTSSLNRKNPQKFMYQHVFCWTIFQSLKQFDKFKLVYILSEVYRQIFCSLGLTKLSKLYFSYTFTDVDEQFTHVISIFLFSTQTNFIFLAICINSNSNNHRIKFSGFVTVPNVCWYIMYQMMHIQILDIRYEIYQPKSSDIGQYMTVY